MALVKDPLSSFLSRTRFASAAALSSARLCTTFSMLWRGSHLPAPWTDVLSKIHATLPARWPVSHLSQSYSSPNSYWDCYGSFDEQRLFSVKFARFSNFFDFCSDLGNPGIRQIVRDSMLTGRWWEGQILINLCGNNNVWNCDLLQSDFFARVGPS